LWFQKFGDYFHNFKIFKKIITLKKNEKFKKIIELRKLRKWANKTKRMAKGKNQSIKMMLLPYLHDRTLLGPRG
jgi:hypothetical protein